MTDFYLNESNVVNRLIEEWKKYGKIIIAYDFDDTVYDFHEKGRIYNDMVSLLKRCKKVGAYFIVFTANNDINMIEAYLTGSNIPFDKINENMEFIKFTARKIYYNVLLDDRAGLKSAYDTLLTVVEYMELERKYERHCV